jgi:hypothetical protein
MRVSSCVHAVYTQGPLTLIEFFTQRLQELEETTLNPDPTVSTQESAINGIYSNDDANISETTILDTLRTVNVQDVDKFLIDNDIDSSNDYTYDPDTGEIYITSNTSTPTTTTDTNVSTDSSSNDGGS